MAVPEWFLAWVDETDTSFSSSHLVVAEDIFSVQVDGREGEVAILTLVLRNPRIGLLNAGRKLWVWLSWTDGANVFPVLFGRLVGIPDNVFGNLVTLIFLAKPLDFDQQKFDLAQTLKTLPWFDPVFIDSRLWDDPDAIVETRSVRYQCTRGDDGAPETVSISDILEGEDGVESFDETEVPAGSISLTISGAPLPQITVKATVQWDQTGAVAALSMPVPLPQINGFNESIYTDFPKAGSSLGGGWAAGPDTFALDLYGAHNLHTATATFNYTNTAKEHTLGDVMSANHSRTFPVGPVGFSQLLTVNAHGGVIYQGGGYGTGSTSWKLAVDGNSDDDNPDINIPYHYDDTSLHVAFFAVKPTLSIMAEGDSLRRTESVKFTLTSDIQSILTLPDPAPSNPDNPIEQPGADVGQPITGEGGTVIEAHPPIGDTSLSYYFPTARGIQSLENRLMWARAQLRQGARVVSASWSIPFERALFMTCRKSAQLLWKNMPGGYVRGKVVAYSIFHNVSTGKRSGTVTIGATPGHEGTTTVTTTTTNDYVESDYVMTGHFASTATISEVSPGADLGYSVPVASLHHGSLPFSFFDIVKNIYVTGSIDQQLAVLQGNGPSYYISGDLSQQEQETAIKNAEQAIQTFLENIETTLHIDLVPISGSGGFETEYDITTSLLKLPRTVDFEAPSNA